MQANTNSKSEAEVLKAFGASRSVEFIALLGLCSAYIQGPLVKIFDFNGAMAEMDHFGLRPTMFFAVAVIVFELAMSALILAGVFRWAAALALAGFTLFATFLAVRFWELPQGMERSMAMNTFFEHLGLAGAFVLVALYDLRGKAAEDKRRVHNTHST
ncbi:DoxX family protein [Rhizobium sp. P32RR-XVIII]|uniref:DoxX family protein n=1 Tax=Rhizobium sp. P32RR-XVIII TaxID=2726738 RepID=UPI0014578575|nr:DoxX family protein [Rhizobium sp. P32RR-XVIII]NLS07019.1 DoxX family protein [Rhizobium sp. P32RR-XVIII]